MNRHALCAIAKEIAAEGHVRHRDFVPATSKVVEYKAIRLAACNGFPID
jgi:hypothetical protein